MNQVKCYPRKTGEAHYPDETLWPMRIYRPFPFGLSSLPGGVEVRQYAGIIEITHRGYVQGKQPIEILNINGIDTREPGEELAIMTSSGTTTRLKLSPEVWTANILVRSAHGDQPTQVLSFSQSDQNRL